MPSIDFAQLKKTIALDDVIRVLGITYLSSGRLNLRGPCPFQCCTDPRICAFNIETHLWFCHRCRHGGDQLALFEAVKQLDCFVAAKLLCAALGIKVPYKLRSKVRRPRAPRRRKEALAEEDEDVLN